MSFKPILSIFLLIFIIFSLNCVIATDNSTISLNSLNDDSNIEITSSYSDIVNCDSLSSSNLENNKLSEENIGSDSGSKIIYVGHNNNTEGGNGSIDNPFTTFKFACDNVSGEDNVTVYVLGGTYYLGEGMISGSHTPLIFNTNNLNIVGINGTVIIKNYFNVKKGGNSEALALTSSSANFTFSNLIFDASGKTVLFLVMMLIMQKQLSFIHSMVKHVWGIIIIVHLKVLMQQIDLQNLLSILQIS